MLTAEEQEVLARENQKLVFYVANRFRSKKHEIDDLVGEARVGMVRALKKYKKDSGIKFSTFAVRCMEKEILRMIRDANTKKRSGKTCSLEMRLVDMIPQPEPDVVNWQDVNQSAHQVLMRRSKRDREIYRLLMAGKTQTEAGRMYGISQHTVSKIFIKTNKQIRDEYWREHG